MPIDEQQKTQMTQTFTAVVRQSPVMQPSPEQQAAVPLDVQRLALAFRMMLDELEPGEAIELQGLYEVLVRDFKQNEHAVLEMCVVLQSRQDKLGVPVNLPANAQWLTDEQRTAIVERFSARANEREREKEREKEQKPLPGQPVGKKEALPDFVPLKKQKPSKLGTTGKPLAVLVLLLSLMTGGFYGYREMTRAPPFTKPATTFDSTMLECKEVRIKANYAFCDLPLLYFTREAPATFKTRATMTKKALAAEGVKTLYVITRENNKVVLVL